jgi:nucleoside-diphosphate-sugar epimerase
MKLFLTGATGYIGGSVAVRLVADGHQVRGLARDRAKADALMVLGIEPVFGELDDEALLAREARAANGVVNTANADHLPSVRAMLAALEGTGKLLVHTSGSSVIGDDARGNVLSDAVFSEDSEFIVAPLKQARHALNQMVLAGAARGVCSVVICPTLIYGTGRGLNPNSIQIPFLVRQAREHGVARVVGSGVNQWSTVHIDDLAALYSLAVSNAAAGAFYFAEHGEVSYRALGEAIAARLGLGPVASIAAERAAEEWGEAKAYFTFGSNSRVRAVRARRELGWTPNSISVLDWIRADMPLES